MTLPVTVVSGCIGTQSLSRSILNSTPGIPLYNNDLLTQVPFQLQVHHKNSIAVSTANALRQQTQPMASPNDFEGFDPADFENPNMDQAIPRATKPCTYCSPIQQ